MMAVRCIGARDFPHFRFLLSAVHPRSLSTSSTFAAGRSESEAPPKSKYKETVLLPCTTFPMRISPDKITENEKHIQKAAGFAELYSWQQRQNRHLEYVLHDGPPYANGVPHIGHAVNKILKDITIRHKLLQGHKVHYIPGWDCHGLPIEMKASGGKGHKDRGKVQDPLDVRTAARKVAEEAIRKQRAAFERWGVLADWGTTYRTFDPTYIRNQLLLFAQLYEKGYIYQDYLPVHYSPHLGTSLAESELEYNPEHISTAVHLALLATSVSPKLQDQLRSLGLSELHIPIWTTTPWTLPSNQAVCFASDQRYAVVSVNWMRQGGTERKLALVWAEPLLNELRRIMGGKLEIICSLEGYQLAEMRYHHPLYERECPLLAGGHVRMDSGSGLVHTAPAHGHDDFLVSLKYQLPVECYVDGNGRYNASAGEMLEGKEVLEEGNEAVLRMLESDEGGGGVSLLLHHESYKHSYPYDWRSHRPVIVRATSQWFLNTALLREKALAALEEVKILPMEGNREAAMVSQLKKRPYWCISRQRVWGTPIPVFYDADTEEPVTNRAIIEHVAAVLGREGGDAWWRLGEEDLLPPELVREAKEKSKPLPRKGQDTLDIWFDSGSSWHCVLDHHPADLYLEGLDQFNGWFLCSLLTSIAATGCAPYKSLYVHGFTVDEEGRKMSKSVGNVVDPKVVTDGGKNKNKDPAYGADVLRWWVANRESEATNSQIGSQQLSIMKKQVQRVRNCLRHVLSCLGNGEGPNGSFEPNHHSLPIIDLRPLDRYILHLLHAHVNQVWKDYENFRYYTVTRNTVDFTSNTVSALYFGCVHDRLYCDARASSKRMSALLVLHHLLHHLVLSIAPILPHLAEEIALHSLIKDKAWRVFEQVIELPPSSWQQPELASIMKVCLGVREELYRNTTLTATNPATLHATITAGGDTMNSLRVLQTSTETTESGLCELFQVARITLNPHPDDTPGFSLVLSESKDTKCLRCRRFTAPEGCELCTRCETVLSSGW